MKKILLSMITITAFVFGTNAQNVNIPDYNFKYYLLGNSAINTNLDTEIQVSEAAAFIGAISCANLSITDLTGIEAFTAITSLACYSNQLTVLDLSNNTALTALYCGYNSLTALDVSNNTALTNLICYYNSLTALDVSNNTALDLLDFSYNSLTVLDVSNNTSLTKLLCSNNSLTVLDVSSNTALEKLYCHHNSLSNLNVANGNNTNFTHFYASSNPVACIQVDDVAWSTANWTVANSNISSSMSFCSPPCIVNIPDANFKAYLVGNTAINTGGDPNEIECSEAAAFTGMIDCNTLSIYDLTGLESFTALTQLNCGNNGNLIGLDLSSNLSLTLLNCRYTNITALDLSNNVNLEDLTCNHNSLTTLDLSNNVNLEGLTCNNNSLTALDVSNNTNLTYLHFDENFLTNINLSNSTSLETLYCRNNSLTALDVSNNTNLTTLNCVLNSSLTSLNVANGNNTNFISFYASSNPNLTCIQVDDVSWSTTNWTVLDYNIDTTAIFSTNCSSTVGVNEQADNYSLSIYPNPTANKLEVRNLKSPITIISIIDVTGKTVKTIIGNVNTVNVSDLTRGIYFIQIQTEKGLVNSKFIKE